MHNPLSNSRCFRSLNLIDDFNREALGFEVGFWLPSERLINTMKRTVEWRRSAQDIRYDKRPENINHAVQQCAQSCYIRLEYKELGKSQQNDYEEKFNWTVRYEWLAQKLFDSIEVV